MPRWRNGREVEVSVEGGAHRRWYRPVRNPESPDLPHATHSNPNPNLTPPHRHPTTTIPQCPTTTLHRLFFSSPSLSLSLSLPKCPLNLPLTPIFNSNSFPRGLLSVCYFLFLYIQKRRTVKQRTIRFISIAVGLRDLCSIVIRSSQSIQPALVPL